MKNYIAINGVLVSITLSIIGCIVADFFGVNAPHALGSQLRLQGGIVVSSVDEWRSR